MTQNKGKCLQRDSLRLSYESTVTALEQYPNLWLPYDLGLELIDITPATSGRQVEHAEKTYEVNILGFERKWIVAEFVKNLERHCMNNKEAYIFGADEIRYEHKEEYNSAFD